MRDLEPHVWDYLKRVMASFEALSQGKKPIDDVSTLRRIRNALYVNHKTEMQLLENLNLATLIASAESGKIPDA